MQVDCIVTTAGGIEEDLIKCLAPTYVGDFYRWKGIPDHTWTAPTTCEKTVQF